MLIKKAIVTKTVSPALGIPMANLYQFLRIGFIFMLIFLCMNIIEVIKDSLISDCELEETT